MPVAVQRPQVSCGRATLALLLLLAASSEAALAATYYVRAAGEDSADGLTPATAKRSIRRAAAEIKNAGDRVVIGPGTYAEGDIEPARSGAEGRPVVFLADTSGTLTGDPPGPVVVMPALPATSGFLFLGRHHVVIDGFTIIGAADAGIQVRPSPAGTESYSIVIRNVSTNDNAKRGMDVSASGSVVLENCRANGNQSAGIVLSGPAGRGFEPLVIHSEASDNVSHGIFLEGVSGARVQSSTFQRNGANGLMARASSMVTVADSTFQDNLDHGVAVGAGATAADAVANASLLGNLVAGNGKGGVRLAGSEMLRVEECVVRHNGVTAVSITGDAAAAIELLRNRVLSNQGDGAFVLGGMVTASDNELQGNTGAGLHVRGCSQLLATGNLATGNEGGGLTVGVPDVTANGALVPGSGAARVVMTNNRVEANGKTAVRVAAEGKLEVSRNNVLDSPAAGIAVITDPLGDLTLTDNTIDLVGTDGVSLAGTAAAILSRNSVRRSGSAGLRLRAYGNLEVSDNLVSQSGAVSIDSVSLALAGDFCAGDCGRDGEVTIDEILTLVGLALSGGGLSGCAAGDTNGDGEVTVDEVLAAVNRASSGCEPPAPAAMGANADPTPTTISVSGNVVEDGGTVGISVVASDAIEPHVTVTRNEIRRHLRGGLFLAGIGRAEVSDNVVDIIGTAGGPVADGISFRDTDTVVATRNRVSKSSGIGLGVGTADDEGSSSVAASDNHLLQNGKAGLNVFAAGDVSVADNLVLQNGSTGISIQTTGSQAFCSVVGNTIGANAGGDGLFLRGPRTGLVRNNRIFSSPASGITLRSAHNMLVFNNLVYVNAAEGIGIGTDDQPCSNVAVLHNTVYANGARGIRIDGDAGGVARGMTVLNNIVSLNNGSGIAVSQNAAWNYLSGFNINSDGYVDGTRRSGFDIAADPRFVDPAGADGVLGGSGFVDDDFRLAQVRAGQPTNSPAIDAGSDVVEVLGIDGSTATTGVPDVGRADAGYHYGASPESEVQVRIPFMPIYVRQDGNDGSDGREPTRALASIRAAAELAMAGVTVVVGPGRYLEGDIRLKNFSGRVAFLADSAGRLTGDIPGPVVVDANGQDTGFVLLNGGPATVSGFHVTGAFSAGIQVRAGADDALIENNVVFSNARRGIEIRDAHRGVLRNNLAYANGTGGLRVEASTGSSVLNNTVYANGEDGIVIGGTAPGQESPKSTVARNIVTGNGTGIKMQGSSSGYTSAHNVVYGPTPFAGNTPRADSDYIGEPWLVDPAGRDGVLGGDGFLDDDFHLQQEEQISPAVDIDFGSLDLLAAGSTRIDGLPDLGAADAGYHYPFVPAALSENALGAPLFVRATGSDSNDGSTPESALASIARALELGGPTAFVVVGPGHYRESGLRMGGDLERRQVAVLIGDAGGVLTDDAAGQVIVDADGGDGPVIVGPALVDGLQLRGGRGPGLHILPKAREVAARNLTICGNAGDAVYSAHAGLDLLNNLLCANGGAAVRLSLRRAAGYTRVINNTLVHNGGGLFLKDTTGQPTRARIFNNLIAENSANGMSLRRHSGGMPARNNLNVDGYGPGTVAAPGDVSLPPDFVGGSRSVVSCPTADEYRVAAHSAALDAGVGAAWALGLGHRSVRADDAPDVGTVDLGYHYPRSATDLP